MSVDTYTNLTAGFIIPLKALKKAGLYRVEEGGTYTESRWDPKTGKPVAPALVHADDRHFWKLRGAAECDWIEGDECSGEPPPACAILVSPQSRGQGRQFTKVRRPNERR